ncbi:MAG: exodeoxyribonuclease VII large subunit [Acidobacteriota bacterium]|nr:exodeoxyribonuclease VII large subunit [Acidobacteriota bacterium]MDH3784301.1 exodeoxyribonuclease VII large subunit [Acidobacteriota bacterium]
MSREIRHGGDGQLHIRFDFDRQLVDRIKTLPNRRWDGAARIWLVPESDAALLAECLDGAGFSYDEATRSLLGDDSLPAATRLPGLFDAEPPGEEAVVSDGWTVSGLNEAVRGALKNAFPTSVWLVGEISGFNKSRHRRHVGFELVERSDDGEIRSKVQATLFERSRKEIERALKAAGNPFVLEDEIVVRVQIRLELYVPWGQYRVTVEGLDVQYTLGEAARRREETIRRLGERGLLELNDRLPIDRLPLRVGLITSIGSDAYNDVLRTLRESGFAFEVTVHGARVQGRATEPSVLNALDWFRERIDAFDTVLICRGGGSRTDLVWFDSEGLGEAVATFPRPVLIGIGHEQDRSVLDSVARSFKTPTATAAWLVERVADTLAGIEQSSTRILELARTRIEGDRERLRSIRQRLRTSGRVQLRRGQQNLRHYATRIPGAVGLRLRQQSLTVVDRSRRIARESNRQMRDAGQALRERESSLGPLGRRLLARSTETLDAGARRLHTIDPRRVVERGFAILRAGNGNVVSRVAAAPRGTRMTAELKDGTMRLRSEGAAEQDPEE